jgi:hypothetical protein
MRGSGAKDKGKGKVRTVLHEFKEGTLHSGSKRGPKVTDRKQAIAIALNQARREGGAATRRALRPKKRSVA